MDEGVGSRGRPVLVRVGAEVRPRPTYGVVFCELPPPGPGLVPAASQRPGSRRSVEPAGGEGHAQPTSRPSDAGGGPGAAARPKLPYVSAEPARAHLQALADAGVGLKTVASLSGVSHGSLSKIVYGQPLKGRPPSRRIRPETLGSILAVTTAQAGGGQRVDAADTWRRLDELVAAGYTREFLARALGSRAAQPRLQVGRVRVRASTAQAVEELHRRLLGRPAPGRAES